MSQIINNSISMLSKGGKQWFQNEMDICGKSVSFETSSLGKNVKIRDSAKGIPSVKYPIFLEASKLTKDDLWSSILKDAALGIFPRRFSFNKGLLIYRNKNKQYTEYVNTDDAHECFVATKFFLQEKGNIYSENDEFEKNKNNKNTDKFQDEIKNWSQIKSNAQKQILIFEFIRKIKNYFSLNEAQTLDLEQTINLGILAGYFDTSNIRLENSAISGIDGLIQKNNNYFFIDIAGMKFKPKKNNKKQINEANELTTLMSTAGLSSDFFDKNMVTTEKIIFLKTWIKFLNGVDKKIAKISN